MEAVDYRDIVEYRFGTAMESKNDSILRKHEWNMHRQNNVSVRYQASYYTSLFIQRIYRVGKHGELAGVG